MNIYDVIIIGAGVVGTAIARRLSRYKLNIALLEKEAEPAFGVSKSNSGIIHPGTQNAPHSLKGRLCVQGNRLIRQISRELGVDFKETGELIIIFSEEDQPRLVQLKQEARMLGVPGLRIVRRGWLAKYEPNLSSEAVAALYAPTAGIISPYRLVYAMAENALRNGVELYTQTRVTGIVPVGQAKQTNFFEINTSTGTFRTRYLVNAAGLFADEVAGFAGVNDFCIYPRKGEEFILDKKQEHLTNHLLFPLPSPISKGILVIKTADGNPMLGPTAEDCGDKEDLATSDAGLQKVLAGAQRMIPSVRRSDIIAYFAGLRPVAGDDFIIRQEATVPGLVTVAGIQSPGLTAAPAIAVLVCNILAKNGLSLKKKAVFHAQRRAPARLFTGSWVQTKSLIKKAADYGDIVCRCELVSAGEIKDAVRQGARTLDGVKFRTRAQAGRCHGSFCTTRIMKILSLATGVPLTQISKKGCGSEVVKEDRAGG